MDQLTEIDDTGATTLVVLLHAYTSNPSRLQALKAAVLDTWPSARTYVPQLPLSLLSMHDLNDVVAELLTYIDGQYSGPIANNTPIRRIILVGHSIGALIARKLYVVACGETEKAPFEAEVVPCDPSGTRLPGPLAAREWAPLVDRIVLLAGMNRGWRITHHISLLRAPFWVIGAGVCHALRLFLRRWPTIYTVRQGSEFITQLRIQWIMMRRHALRQEKLTSNAADQPPCSLGKALTIQLLGSRDDMVAPEDNVDLVSGQDFVYIDVPYSGHADIVELDDREYGVERRERFVEALTASKEELDRRHVVPADEHFDKPDETVARVLFVIHGIRDAGYWTHKIARRVKQRVGQDHGRWATETSSYGYFPMLPFLFPWYRRKKVEWLMDHYTEAMARYPTAKFYYVGHSNGTYLLARALELYPCCSFEHVVFAGSVVRRAYDWSRFISGSPARVKAVLNIVASSDWVVAFFPKFFQVLRLQDLGSAGHDGFLQVRPGSAVYEFGVRGGHGAGTKEKEWDKIADFVINGEASVYAVQTEKRERSLLVHGFGLCPPLVWTGIAAVVWKGWEWIESVVRSAVPEASAQSFWPGLALAAYAFLLWLIVTRI